jgi:hypothetical protein
LAISLAIYRVLANLIGNAIAFGAKHKAVAVTVVGGESSVHAALDWRSFPFDRPCYGGKDHSKRVGPLKTRVAT